MKTIQSFILISLLSFSFSSHAVEIFPLLGLRGGGEFIDESTSKKRTLDASEMVGLILSFPYERGKTFEIYYSRQSTQISSVTTTPPVSTSITNIPLTIDYLHFGGTAPISEQKEFKTFVSGGMGFSYLSPDLTGAQSDLRASISLGVGLLWPISQTIALRIETRALATLYNNNSAIFCNGGCTLKVNGNFFLQGEVFAGLGFKF